MTGFHHAWLAELHATLEAAQARVERTKAAPNSHRHRKALIHAQDALHALMRFEQSA